MGGWFIVYEQYCSEGEGEREFGDFSVPQPHGGGGGAERESLGILASFSRIGEREFGDFSVPQPHRREREREFGGF